MDKNKKSKVEIPIKGDYIYEPNHERLKMAFDFLADIILEKQNEKQKTGKDN